MSTYIVEIPPASSLASVESSVSAEEAGASRFLSSSISYHEGKITNLATFDILAPGTVPKHLHFVVAGSPAPANTKSEWAGVIIIAGTTKAVATYRDQ